MSYSFGCDQPIVPDERFPSRLYPLFSIGSQGDIRNARVPAVERPFGLSMADDKAAWSCHYSSVCPGRVLSGEYEV